MAIHGWVGATASDNVYCVLGNILLPIPQRDLLGTEQQESSTQAQRNEMPGPKSQAPVGDSISTRSEELQHLCFLPIDER